MIALHKRHAILQRPFSPGRPTTGEFSTSRRTFENPGRDGPASHIRLLTVGGLEGDSDLHAILSIDDGDFEYQRPRVAGWRWLRAVGMGLDSPVDIAELGQEQPIEGTTYRANGRSVVVLTSR